jgi:protease secretion system outer membrane protein
MREMRLWHWMQPASIDEWKAIALAENPEISVQRYAVEAASQEVRKNRAAHAPRLDLVMNVNGANSDTTDTYRQDATGRSIGVQLIIPIYSGGSVSALTRQAAANHEKAKAILESKFNDVLVELHKQYNATLNSQFRIDALIKSVNSARLLIDATQKSVKAGMRTNLDSLNAQQKLFEAKLDLALARYNYLISFLRLRKAAGTLSASDLQSVATKFEPSR